MPTDLMRYAAGLVQVPYRRMILAILLGEVPLVPAYLFLTQRVFDVLG